MQSDTPPGDPRRERINRNPRIAIGHADPCIISMETTLPGEIPMLVQLWAGACREVRGPGGQSRWELTDAVILKSLYHKRHLLRTPEWSFKAQLEKSATVACPSAVRSTKFSDLGSMYDYVPAHIYQWHIRYLDRGTEAILRRVLAWHSNHPERVAPVILTHSGVDWPSVVDALAAYKPRRFQKAKVPARRRGSLIRRVLSSVFKKKQPAHA